MKANTVSGLIAIGVLAVAGCHQIKSPFKVQSDITRARDSASKNDARAVDHEAKVDLSASDAIGQAQTDADSKMNSAAAATAVTEAEGANKIAVAGCEGMSNDIESACREQAKANLDMAKARANLLKEAHN